MDLSKRQEFIIGPSCCLLHTSSGVMVLINENFVQFLSIQILPRPRSPRTKSYVNNILFSVLRFI